MNMRSLLKLAEEMGATIELDEEEKVLFAWAPEGCIWDVTTASCIGSWWGKDLDLTKYNAVDFLMSEMSYGYYQNDYAGN